MRTLLRLCNRTHSCASEVLLPSTDAAVCAELARRQAGRAASGLAARASGQKPGTGPGGYNVGKAMEYAQSRGVQWGSFGPSPAMMGDAWFQTLTKQQQYTVCFSLKTRPDSLLLRDVSQSLGQARLSTRSAEDSRHCACAMLPSQMLMVFAPDQPFRLLLGREALVLQGFPSQDPTLSELIDSFPESQMADLAGNMVSTTVFLAMAMAAISAVSWKASPMKFGSSTDADCAHAVSLLRRIMPQVPSLTPVAPVSEAPEEEAVASAIKRQRR